MLNELMQGLQGYVQATNAAPPQYNQMAPNSAEIARMLWLIHMDLSGIANRIH